MIRGSNFWGKVYLEAGASFLNWGSNIINRGNVRSANSLVNGSFGNDQVISAASYAECGGTCPTNVQRFDGPDANMGLGFAVVFESAVNVAREGAFNHVPLAGLFSAYGYFDEEAGFRCVRAPTP